jgi:hypothetical protein
MRAYRFGFVAVALVMAAPANAEVQKFMFHCEGRQQLCPFFRPLVEIPDGWVEDKEATQHFGAVILVPKGIAFDNAEAVIYALARYNPKKQTVSDFLADGDADWKGRAKDAKISTLAEFSRAAGKGGFVRRAFEAASLKEQGYELQSVTSDTDKDGNHYIVTITLSANSKTALTSAEEAYAAILAKY